MSTTEEATFTKIRAHASRRSISFVEAAEELSAQGVDLSSDQDGPAVSAPSGVGDGPSHEAVLARVALSGQSYVDAAHDLAGEITADEAYLLTPVLSERADAEEEIVELAGGTKRRRFWKNLLPIGTTISYAGRVLKFDGPTIDKTVKNFKAKAVDAVPFVMVNEKNAHSDAPELARGVVTDMRKKGKHLQVLVEARTKEAETFLSDFPEVGISAKFHPNYVREADGVAFGPTIFHAAATWRPHIPKLGLWGE